MLTVLLLATPATQQIQKRQHPSKKMFECTGMYLCTLLLNSKCSFFSSFSWQHKGIPNICVVAVVQFSTFTAGRATVTVCDTGDRICQRTMHERGRGYRDWHGCSETELLIFWGGLTFATLNLCCKTAEAFVLETHKEAVFFSAPSVGGERKWEGV